MCMCVLYVYILCSGLDCISPESEKVKTYEHVIVSGKIGWWCA